MRVQRSTSPLQSSNLAPDASSKVLKNSNRGSECPQILMYLERLQRLVPTCPKDRPVNKLELIQCVIDYIYDLEHVLSSSDSESDDSMDST
ncbi:hypothetical protein HAZT_HAZT005662 [Hyalella azteca]|uniref:Uncharacterized protein n=1 Tax=Hyalella azteca TaxID=294128 RepID=A0A6A0H822_HYAAZ|nr:hypothetical protein HAZT_HAZT005662 [Hyalella azteca]